MRTTARREEIDWAHSESVYEIVPMQDTEVSVDSTSKVLVSNMRSVSLSNRGKSLKLRHYDISRAYFQGTVERLIYIRFPQKIVRNVTKTKLADGSRACMELKTLPTSGSLVVRTGSLEIQEAFEEANTAQHCSTIQIKM